MTKQIFIMGRNLSDSGRVARYHSLKNMPKNRSLVLRYLRILTGARCPLLEQHIESFPYKV